MSIPKFDEKVTYDSRPGISPHLACPKCYGELISLQGLCVRCKVPAREFYDSPKD